VAATGVDRSSQALSSLQGQVDHLEARNKVLETELVKYVSIAEERDQLQQNLVDAERNNQELLDLLEKLHEEADRQKDHLRSLVSDMDASDVALSQMKQLWAATNSKIEELCRKLESGEYDVAKHQAGPSYIPEDYEMLEDELQNLRRQVQDTIRRMDRSVEDSLQQSQANVGRLTQLLHQKEEECGRMRLVVDAMSNEILILKRQKDGVLEVKKLAEREIHKLDDVDVITSQGTDRLLKLVDGILEEENHLLRNVIDRMKGEIAERKEIHESEAEKLYSLVEDLRLSNSAPVERLDTNIFSFIGGKQVSQLARHVAQDFTTQNEYHPTDPRDPIDVAIADLLKSLRWPFRVYLERVAGGEYLADRRIRVRLSNGRLYAAIGSRQCLLRSYLEDLYSPILPSADRVFEKGEGLSSAHSSSVQAGRTGPGVSQAPRASRTKVGTSSSGGRGTATQARGSYSLTYSQKQNGPLYPQAPPKIPVQKPSSGGEGEDDEEVRRLKREALRLQVMSMRGHR
jgi:hypothetical protein